VSGTFRPDQGSQPLYKSRDLKAIAARWDAKASRWDRELAQPGCHLNEDEGYSVFLRHARQIVDQHQDFCSRHGVIDAGCGTGLVLAEVLPSFAWGLGVDISEKMIAAAEQKRLRNVRFLQGDCFQLGTISSKAGAVFSRGVLLSHYGPDQGELLLKAAKSALMPGGFVMFDFLNAAARGRHVHEPENKAYYDDKSILLLAQRAGLVGAKTLGEPARRVRLLLGAAED
jgi:predicted TPR repeat methyltransferase